MKLVYTHLVEVTARKTRTVSDTVASVLPTAAYVTASATVVIWAASRMYETLKSIRDRRRDMRNFVFAFYAEIDFNTWEMEDFAEHSVDIEAVAAALQADSGLVPHVTDSRHTLIYRNNIDKLSYLDRDLIGDLVAFYGYLEKLKTRIDGL